MLPNRIMIYVVCFILSLPAIFLLPPETQAHAPKDIALRYDALAQTLSVTISHNVSEPRKHYIKKVTIKRNGELVSIHEYISQPETSPFTYTYPVEAKVGDTLEAAADCSYFGLKTGELTIGR